MKKEKQKKLTAADAVAEKRAFSKLSKLTPAAVKELKILCDYNDTQTNNVKRVGAQTAIRILRSHGWNGCSAEALRKITKETLGREWGGP